MKKIVLIVFLLFFLGFVGISSFVISLYIDTNKDFKNLVNGNFYPQPTKIYDSSNHIIAILGSQKRKVVSYSQISINMKKAIMGAEDARFFQHGPVSFRSIIRAAFEDLIHGKVVQGGSTLTQQLVKNLYLTPQKTLYRKLKEAVLSYKISKYLTKQQILALYLNTVYFGNGAYGIDMASRSYFDEPPSKLTILQSAMLAGLVQAPSLYDPYINPALAQKRTAYVINRMYVDKFISKKQYYDAIDSKIVLRKRDSLFTNGYKQDTAYFVQHVKNWLIKHYGQAIVNDGGLRVYTTLNENLQKDAYVAVKNGILNLTTKENKNVPYYIKYARNWLIDKYGQNSSLQTALISIDPKTGYVEALIGGYSYRKSQFDRATQALRQTGSAFKPIVYLTALEEGFTPMDKIEDEPITFSWGDKSWSPQNYTYKFRGPITLQYALAHSVNVAAVRLLDKVGIENAKINARKLGITEKIPNNLTIALGSASITLEQLAHAYCSFDNYGLFPRLIFIKKVVNKDGEIIYSAKPDLQRVFPSSIGFVLTKMLQSVVKEGTGVYALALNRPAAGKTGTSNHGRDNWFMGFTPQLVTGVWVGYDNYRPCGPYAVGATMALPIWLDYMKNALNGQPSVNFRLPRKLPNWAYKWYFESIKKKYKKMANLSLSQ